MSDRATAYNVTAPHASLPSGGDLTVRPKVLRRPAQFGHTTMIETPMPVLIPLHPTAHAEEKSATPPFRAWQDDGKFAITLLAIVIVVNLAVSTWLSAISPENPLIVQAPPESASIVHTNAAVHVLDNNARDISEQ